MELEPMILVRLPLVSFTLLLFLFVDLLYLSSSIFYWTLNGPSIDLTQK